MLDDTRFGYVRLFSVFGCAQRALRGFRPVPSAIMTPSQECSFALAGTMGVVLDRSALLNALHIVLHSVTIHRLCFLFFFPSRVEFLVPSLGTHDTFSCLAQDPETEYICLTPTIVYRIFFSLFFASAPFISKYSCLVRCVF